MLCSDTLTSDTKLKEWVDLFAEFTVFFFYIFLFPLPKNMNMQTVQLSVPDIVSFNY